MSGTPTPPPSVPELLAEARRRLSAETDEQRAERLRRMAERQRAEIEAIARAETAQRLAKAHVPAAFREPARMAQGRGLWRELSRPGGPWCALLYGEVGRGKTDLACSVALAAVGERVASRFCGDAEMLALCREAMDDASDSEAACVGRLCSVGLLVIDDLGKARYTDWGLDVLWRVVDGRYRERRPTVVTSNLDPAGLGRFLGGGTLAQAVVSRLSEGLGVRLDGPDRRLSRG